MKCKSLKYIVLTLLFILFNNSYSWAESFKGGPSDQEEKVLYFILLSMILLVGTTVVLFFALLAKGLYRKDSSNYYYYHLFATLVILLVAALFFRQAALFLLLFISISSFLGLLVFKFNSPEMNLKSYFAKFFLASIIGGILAVFAVISTFL